MKLKYYIFLIFLILSFYDQLFYRYEIVFNVGTNWRVIDILVVTLFVIYLFSKNRKKVFSGEFLKVKTVIILYSTLLVVAIIRGLFEEGFFSIGLGRYSALEFLLLPYIVSTINSYKKIIKSINIIILTVIISILAHFFFNLDKIPMLLQANEKGRFLDSYTVDGIATLFLIIFPFIFLKKRKSNYFIVSPFIIVIFLFFFIVLIQVRSVWVSTILGSFFMILLFFHNNNVLSRNKKKIVIAIFILFSIILVNIILFNNFFELLLLNRLKFIQSYKDDPNGYWRILAWTSSITETIKHHFWTGSGFVQNVWFDRWGHAIYVWEHNQYVFIFRTMGLIGLFIYFLFLLVIIIKTFKLIRSSIGIEKILLIGLISALIQNIIYMFFYMQPVFLIIVLGFILSINNIKNFETRFL